MVWLFGLVLLSFVIWIYLLGFRGQFWRSEPCLDTEPLSKPKCHLPYPPVCVVIPARDEAEVIAMSLQSLLTQDYPGDVSLILVDDHSTDGTAAIALATAQEIYAEHPEFSSRIATILPARDLPPRWTGKLWAVDQGAQQAMEQFPKVDFLLLTDADIQHDRHNLQRLVDKAIAHKLDMTSVMVSLRCESLWETLLIPAFVFFFQKLYPFRWVNQVDRAIAAAAGGCILIRPQALQRIGGIGSIRHALIDDCALAKAVKWHQFPPVPLAPRPPSEILGSRSDRTMGYADANPPYAYIPTPAPLSPYETASPLTAQPPSSPVPPRPSSPAPPRPIWIGLSQKTQSLRPYDDLKTIWDMVARTAYTQLNYSPLLLLGAVLGMLIVYLVPVVGLMIGLIMAEPIIATVGLLTWILMAIAYSPILNFYKRSPLLAFALPGIAVMYTLMTVDSALRYWQGRGGAWKGRTYSTGE